MNTNGRMEIFMRAQSCCGCISPRTGIHILSLLAIVYSAFNMIMVMIWQEPETTTHRVLPPEFVRYIQVLLIDLHIMNIAIRASLIVGVRQNKPALMLPAICSDFTGILIGIPLALSLFAIPGTWATSFVCFTILVLFLALAIHWFSVEYAYYENLRAQSFEYPPGPIKYNPADI